MDNKYKFSNKHAPFNITPEACPETGLSILSTVLVAALLLGGCARPGNQTQITNIRGYACDTAGLVAFDQLQIDPAGRVLCRGSDCQDMPPPGRVIDASGKTLWAGLIDAHAHLLNLGMSRQQLELTGTRSLQDVQSALHEWVEQHPGTGLIVGRGWNQMQWPEKTFPHAADLDEIVKDRPVILERIDGHAFWANSAALATAGVTAMTVAPVGGEIITDEDGSPTGILVDNAMGLVTDLIPEPGQADYARAYLLAMQEANSLGLTGVHEAGTDYAQLLALRQLAESGQLSLRIAVMLSDTDDNLERQGQPASALYDDKLDIRSVKIYADGALGSRGAALLAPYSDRPQTSGLLFLDEAALAGRVRNANARGYQAAVHAIGDRANHVALNAIAAAQENQVSSQRNRIEHAQVLALPDIRRFSELGVIASMQPVHATSDMWMAEARLDEARLNGAYAWRSLLDSGARLAFGSDFPVEEVNPFYGLHAAVARSDRDGKPDGGWRIEEAVSLEEAFCGFTRDAAFAAHQETRVGSLRPGQWADFILLEQDPFEIPAADLWKVRVRETWLAGKRVFLGNSD